MSFDPKKPCVTLGSRYPVEILKVLDRPDCYGAQIVGAYVDHDGSLNVETWAIDGRFYVSGKSKSLDLVNVTVPARYTADAFGRVLKDGRVIADAITPDAAASIAEALNVCAGVKP